MSARPIDLPGDRKINWTNGFAFAIFHLGSVAALFTFSWPAFAVAIFLFWMCTGLGISMGYHRLHTHRSYQVPLGLEWFFAVCGALTLEGGPIFWVATHRIHHQKSDQPGDPHSPRDGGWWAHMGWLLVGPSKHNDTPLMSKYAPDLAKDPFLCLVEHLSLGSHDRASIPAVRSEWSCLRAVGDFPPRRRWFAHHLAGKLRHAHVGQSPLRYSRRLPQQLAHRPNYLRRGVA